MKNVVKFCCLFLAIAFVSCQKDKVEIAKGKLFVNFTSDFQYAEDYSDTPSLENWTLDDDEDQRINLRITDDIIVEKTYGELHAGIDIELPIGLHIVEINVLATQVLDYNGASTIVADFATMEVNKNDNDFICNISLVSSLILIKSNGLIAPFVDWDKRNQKDGEMFPIYYKDGKWNQTEGDLYYFYYCRPFPNSGMKITQEISESETKEFVFSGEELVHYAKDPNKVHYLDFTTSEK